MNSANDNLSPKISVVIPTCHRNDLLAKCLDCLASGVQTLPSDQYEVIVTDDGSHSTAKQMIQDCYPWVRWREGPRKGPAANRNNGAAAAHGQWLAFTDDDCLPSTGWLEEYVSSLNANIKVYEGKTTCAAGLHSPREESPINLHGGCLWSCNFMVHKSAFEAMRGFNTDFTVPGGEDIDFRVRLTKSGYIIPFVESAIVDHPPRKCRWGTKAGELWESQILLRGEVAKTRTFPLRLIVSVFKIRLKNIARFPFQKDTMLALLSMFIELFYIAQNARSWQLKHSGQKVTASFKTGLNSD